MIKQSELIELLDAIDHWCEVDSDVADNGWTHENEYSWDDAKNRMVSLATEVREGLSSIDCHIGWCYVCDDNENRDNMARPQFFKSLVEAKAALKRGFKTDRKMLGKDNLRQKETWIDKDGMKAQVASDVGDRLIHYSITEISFAKGV